MGLRFPRLQRRGRALLDHRSTTWTSPAALVARTSRATDPPPTFTQKPAPLYRPDVRTIARGFEYLPRLFAMPRIFVDRSLAGSLAYLDRFAKDPNIRPPPDDLVDLLSDNG